MRRRASRPQLKRDPLGSSEASVNAFRVRSPFLLAGMAAFAFSSPERHAALADNRLVYEAVLDSVARNGTVIVVADSGPFLRSWACLSVLRALRPRLPVRAVPYAEVAPGPYKKEGAPDYWAQFRTKFPGADGWYILSKVEYRDGDHAKVVYSHFCGWLCGEGGPVELERRQGGWRVTSIKIIWVS